MPYTTTDLIRILDQELRATRLGKRVLLSPEDRINDPVLAKALGTDQMSRIMAYQDFRTEIHRYQQKHQISGLVWHECRFRGKSVCVPELHPQLFAVEGDKETLMAAKAEILAFWWEAAESLTLWGAAYDPPPLSRSAVEQLIETAEWAEISAIQAELYLGLCWGDPREYHCQWAYPASGCHRVVAAAGKPTDVKMWL